MENEMTSSGEQQRLWEELHQRTCNLFAAWRLYQELYGNKEVVDQMNRVSGVGFRIIQDCLVHEQIRIVMALTDGEGQGDRSNLTIKRLLGMLDDDTTNEAEKKLAAIGKPLGVLRAHRNKRLQHFDLNTATGDHALPKLMVDHLDDAVKGVGDVMSDLSSAIMNAAQAYEDIVIQNAEGAIQWMLSDTLRLRYLRRLTFDPEVSDSQIRELAKNRSDRHDREILG